MVRYERHKAFRKYIYIFFKCRFSGDHFKKDIASRGWYERFMDRHPELTSRLPSLIDPGRYSMSCTSVFDTWFDKAETFLREQGLFDQKARIYNIDESWFCGKSEQKQRVVVQSGTNIPYKLFDGVQSHTTISLCIGADGTFLPPMLTFKGTIPDPGSICDEGPKDALYTRSESNHL